MNSARWTCRCVKALFAIGSGAFLIGTGCANDVKNALVSAGLDFVEGGAEAILNGVIPVNDIVAAMTGAAG